MNRKWYLRDQARTHPCHSVDVACAFVACVQRSGSSSGVDVPYV